jgi:hypothetical protein
VWQAGILARGHKRINQAPFGSIWKFKLHQKRVGGRIFNRPAVPFAPVPPEFAYSRIWSGCTKRRECTCPISHFDNYRQGENISMHPDTSVATSFQYDIPIETQVRLVAETGFSHISLGTQLEHSRYLLHDRDQKFCREFRDTVAARGVKCLPLPARSPNLNAHSERWVRSIKEEWPVEADPVRREVVAARSFELSGTLSPGTKPPR